MYTISSRDPSPSAKRHKAFHTTMSAVDTPMSDEPTFLPSDPHGPLDDDLHGPLLPSTSSNILFTSSLTAGLKSSTNRQTQQPHAMNGHQQQQQQPIMSLQVKKLSPNAKTPTRGSKFAAGYDIYAAETMVVPARGKAMIGTGIAIAVPIGTCEFMPSHFWCCGSRIWYLYMCAVHVA